MAIAAPKTEEGLRVEHAQVTMPVPTACMKAGDRMKPAELYFDVEVPLHEAVDKSIARYFPEYHVVRVEYGKIRWRDKYPFSFTEPPTGKEKEFVSLTRETGFRWAYLKSTVWLRLQTEAAQE